MAKLVVRLGTWVQEYPLGEAPVTVGRSPEVDVCVNDRHLSRQHLTISFTEGRHVLHDLGSTNGTIVNNLAVKSHTLAHGDTIALGEARLLYLVDDSPPPNVQAAAEALKALPEVEIEEGGFTRVANTQDLIQHVEEIAEPMPDDASTPAAGILSSKPGGGSSEATSIRPTKRESQLFFTLYQACKEISAAVTSDEILQKAIRLCFDVVNAERGILILRRDGAMEPAVAYHRGQGLIPVAEVPFSSTVVDRVIRDRVSMIHQDTMSDPDLREAYSIVAHNIRSAICVPLWEEEDVHGAIYMDNRASSYAFTQQDLQLLSAVANLVALRLRQDRLAASLRLEAFRRENLARYFSPDLAKMILEKGIETKPGLAQREVTVLYADIMESTRLAETLGPMRASQLLNSFYEICRSAVFAHQGHVNNYIGDAVLAIFNTTTLELQDHPDAAVRAALDIVQGVRAHGEKRPDDRFSLRIGINTGLVAIGNVGDATHLQYTALGDPVNVVERLSKLPGPNGIVVGEETYAPLESRYSFRALGDVPLRGRERPLRAFLLLGPA